TCAGSVSDAGATRRSGEARLRAASVGLPGAGNGAAPAGIAPAARRSRGPARIACRATGRGPIDFRLHVGPAQILVESVVGQDVAAERFGRVDEMVQAVTVVAGAGEAGGNRRCGRSAGKSQRKELLLLAVHDRQLVSTKLHAGTGQRDA